MSILTWCGRCPVFSHLSDSWAEWLLELHRITRPGGRLIISVMGEALSERIAGEPWQEDRVGMNVLGYGRPWSDGGPMVLHSQWWIRAHWGRAFTIKAFVPEGAAGQDAVVLRREDRPAPSVQELLEPEPGEPRELARRRSPSSPPTPRASSRLRKSPTIRVNRVPSGTAEWYRETNASSRRHRPKRGKPRKRGASWRSG